MSTNNNNNTNKPSSVHEDEYGLEVVSDRLKETTITTMANNDNVNNLNNKPDYRELDLGSPVSPLRTRGSGPNPGSSATTATTTTTTTNTNTTATTSSSSSSSGSVSGRASGQNPTQKAHSGELGIRQVGHHHARSDSWGSSGGGTGSGSHPLIYSGGVWGSGGGSGSGGSVNSPPLNVLPAGNICPSGRIAKGGGMGVGMMGAAPAPRQGALGSGHGYYGHGSIMRSGGSGGGSGGGERRRGEVFEGSDPGRRGGGGSVGGGMDPEELKRLGNEQYKKRHFSEALSLYDRAIGISPANAAYRSNRAAALTGLGRISEAVKECEEAVRLDPCYGRAHLRLGSLLVR